MAGDMSTGRAAAVLVCLVLVCWCRGPAHAVELRVEADLDTKTMFMAPRPAPPASTPAAIPEHNYTQTAHNYTHAVVGRSKHKVWIRQLQYKVGDQVRVDRVTLTEVFNDTKKASLYLRGRTTAGAGVCLVELQKNSTRGAAVTAPFRETLVSLDGPLAAAGKGPLASFCRQLHVYKVHQMPPHGHKHKERRTRYAYKTTMRVLAFFWRNRRILGLPFGVRGDFEYRG